MLCPGAAGWLRVARVAAVSCGAGPPLAGRGLRPGTRRAGCTPRGIGGAARRGADTGGCGDKGAQSHVHPAAEVAHSATLLPGVSIGEGSTVGGGCVIGPDVAIGSHCVIGPHCSVANATLGDRVVLLPGARIGQDGFGFTPTGDRKAPVAKKPQLLRVQVGDDAEIGANSTVDRGSWRDTTVGAFTKIDNLVQVGHNVVIGRACLIAAQAGIAGSTTLGDSVMVGGQAGIAQHLTVGDRAQIAAKSGVMQNVEAGAKVGGTPAVPIRQFHRQTLILRRMAMDGRGADAPDA